MKELISQLYYNIFRDNLISCGFMFIFFCR